jgi:hypothetical protein
VALQSSMTTGVECEGFQRDECNLKKRSLGWYSASLTIKEVYSYEVLGPIRTRRSWLKGVLGN